MLGDMRTYQQFSLALAIPESALIRPGPETTKHNAGLQNEKKLEQRELDFPQTNNNKACMYFCLFWLLWLILNQKMRRTKYNKTRMREKLGKLSRP